MWLPPSTPPSKLWYLILRKFFAASGIREIASCQRRPDGNLLVVFSAAQAKKLLTTREICGVSVEPVVPLERNVTPGVISLLTEGELLELLRELNEGVLDVRKLSRLEGEELRPSNSAVVTFLLPDVPEKVSFVWEDILVRSYIRKPPWCYW